MTTPINTVSTFTPVDGANWFVKQSALYLSPLSGVKKIAVHTISADAANSDKRLCALQDYETTCLATLMKVVTYIATAGILVLAAFIVTYAYRCFNDFHYLPENSSQTQPDATGGPEAVSSGSTTQQSQSDSSGEGLLSCGGMPEYRHPENLGEAGTPSSAEQGSPTSAEETLKPAAVNKESSGGDRTASSAEPELHSNASEELRANRNDNVDPPLPQLAPKQPANNNAILITAEKATGWGNLLLAAKEAGHFDGNAVSDDSEDDLSSVGSPRSLGQSDPLIDVLSEVETTPMSSPRSASPQVSDHDEEPSLEALAAFRASIVAGLEEPGQSSSPASPVSSAGSSPRLSSSFEALRDRNRLAIDVLLLELPEEKPNVPNPSGPSANQTPLTLEQVLAAAGQYPGLAADQPRPTLQVKQSGHEPPLQPLGGLETNNSPASDPSWFSTISSFLAPTALEKGTTQARELTLPPSNASLKGPTLVSVDSSPYHFGDGPTLHKDKTVAKVTATTPSKWSQFKNNVTSKLRRQTANYSFVSNLWE